MNTMTLRYRNPGSQSGAALITTLIFLVIMTMLALASMTTTTLEEKMAANSQETNRVFQAAESGLARAYNDDAAFNTSNTAASPYSPTAATIGDYYATLSYTSIYIQATKPPRQAMFEVGTTQAYHFDLSAQASTPGATTTTLNQGAYQIGPAGIN